MRAGTSDHRTGSGRRRLLLAWGLGLVLLSFGVTQASELQIRAVSHAAATPGTRVSIAGGPFDSAVRVVLGELVIQPALLERNRLEFLVPPLAAGSYALALRTATGSSLFPFFLQVLAPVPEILALTPDNLAVCAPNQPRLVRIQLRQLARGASLLLDGKQLPYEQPQPEQLSFSIPPLPAGAYGVAIRNPDGRTSLPQPLYLNDLPAIHAVSSEQIDPGSYRLTIAGQNFSPGAALLIEQSSGDFPAAGVQHWVLRLTDRPAVPGSRGPQPRDDSLRFVDCGTLVYTRHPYSSQDKALALRIVNPDGKTSNSYRLEAP